MDQATPQSTPEERMLAFVEQEDSVRPEIENEEDKPDRFEDGAPEPKSDAEAADLAEDEQESDQSDENTPEDRILRLKHDGVDIEKPESEVIALAQQGFDYTQKTQKLAEDRKAVETFANSIKEQQAAFQQQVQIQSALISDIAEATAIDKQLAQYQNLDWQGLSNSDPVEAQKLFFAFNQLQTQKGQKVAEINRKQQEFGAIQQQNLAKQIELGKEQLAKDIPGWGPELAKSLVVAGKEYGFDDSELAHLTDPRAVKLLHDAAQWRKFQKEKPVVDKKVSTASPTVKPGAKDSKNAVSASVKANRDALRKTGKSDYAAKLIERMI